MAAILNSRNFLRGRDARHCAMRNARPFDFRSLFTLPQLNNLRNPASHCLLLAHEPKNSSVTVIDSADTLTQSHEDLALSKDMEDSNIHSSQELLAKVKLYCTDLLNNRLTGLVMLNSMALLMGSNWVILKETDSVMDPFIFAALRFTIASVAIIPFIQNNLNDKKILFAGFELGIWAGLGYLAQAEALVTTDASRASLISTFTVLMVPILAGMTGKHIRPLVWASAVAALAGTSLLEESGTPPNIGDFMSLLSALFFGLQLFRTEHYSHSLPRSATMPVISLTCGTVALLASMVVGVQHAPDIEAFATHLSTEMPLLTDKVLHGGFDCLPWGSLAYTSLCSTDLVLVLEMVALQTVSSSEAALIYTLEPVSGALMAWAFLGERWGVLGWVGAALILGSTLVVQLSGGADGKTPAKGSIDV